MLGARPGAVPPDRGQGAGAAFAERAELFEHAQTTSLQSCGPPIRRLLF